MATNTLQEFFLNFRLPINRGNENIQTLLANHFEKFNSALETLSNGNNEQEIYSILEKNKGNVQDLSATILNVLEKYHQGNILQAHQIFEDKMFEIEDYLVSSDIRGRDILNRFYRIRPDKGAKRRDLFHIPFNLATKVGAYRYSIAGVPSLYLGTDLQLCWFESNLPNQFYWSEFIVDEQADYISLIDFTGTPFRNASNAHKLLTPSSLNNKPSNEFTANMITTYPLMAACSLSVTDKQDKFIPEYIIPQMLLGWVRKSTKYRGIAYFSSSASIETRKYTAFNVVLPTIKVKDTGYCEKLKQEFKLSIPKKIDISKIFNSLNEYNSQIRNTRNTLNLIYREFGFQPLESVLLLCENFFSASRQLMDYKTKDMTHAYQCIKMLYSVIDQYVACEDSYRQLLEQTKDFQQQSELYKSKAREAWGNAWFEIKNMKDALLRFQNIEWRHFSSTCNKEVFCFIDDDKHDLSETFC